MRMPFLMTLVFLGFAMAQTGCRKKDDAPLALPPLPPKLWEVYTDSIIGTWTWAQYGSSMGPQGYSSVKLDDTSLSISKVNDSVIRALGYDFTYTDSVGYAAGHYRERVDTALFVAYEAIAYLGPHKYLYLELNRTTDSISMKQYSGGRVSGDWHKYETRIQK